MNEAKGGHFQEEGADGIGSYNTDDDTRWHLLDSGPWPCPLPAIFCGSWEHCNALPWVLEGTYSRYLLYVIL